jgi:hypothetical protein
LPGWPSDNGNCGKFLEKDRERIYQKCQPKEHTMLLDIERPCERNNEQLFSACLQVPTHQLDHKCKSLLLMTRLN